MELNLKGRTVLITGASRGIGESVAQVMAAEGCNLILTNDAQLSGFPDVLVEVLT